MLKAVFAATAALALAGQAAPPAPAIQLYAFECGKLQEDLSWYSDTFRFEGQKREFVAGCFLIRHPKGVLLWDTGLTPDLIGKPTPEQSLAATIPDRLKALGLTPAAVTYVGISHYHADHTGGARDFPNAELLIGARDWEALRALKDNHPRAAPLAHWRGGKGKMQAIPGDHDVFGDGAVQMLAMPGHTPGHTALLVKLPRTGAVLLSGDEYHFRENRALLGVPKFNTSRAETLASHARFEEIAKVLKAKVIIQHDARDLALLPAFPKAAE
ncbi:N-acyl homoserine lactonase family protein [Sphingomonas sp. BT-65]|uniref:N-acyl homoserine lactonase family protein n=1 Tax=Sphingomonas sp. BT-65 TaxID=2989821 RepID=UPI0022364E5C|nr:N-acyl homoserine lactonase family protein [Sphingomonas sp. BT-65]MCW4460339.1 N-acyl homoserine lactonase family protein [Sphingomonas sp. BT-65]